MFVGASARPWLAPRARRFDRPRDFMDRSQQNSVAVPSPPTTWWREMTGYHWWVLLVATLGCLCDSIDQSLFVLARTPALRELLPHSSQAELTTYAVQAT